MLLTKSLKATCHWMQGMNLLGCKWFPHVSYWEDKPAHKTEDFRARDKNLHRSLTELRSTAWTKSEYIKRMLLLPCYSQNTTTNPCFLLNCSCIHKILCRCNEVWRQQLLFIELCGFPSAETKSGSNHTVGRNMATILPAVKLVWFPNENLTGLREAKGNKLLRHTDT